MAFVYEVNGQRVEFEREPTERDIDEAARSLGVSAKPQPKYDKPSESVMGQIGRGAASLADTGVNLVTGTLDAAAKPLARAYYGSVGGLKGQALEQKIAEQTTSPKDVVGRMAGVTNTPEYNNQITRRIGTALGEGINENVLQPVSQAAQRAGMTSVTPEYVGDVATALGPLIPQPTIAGAAGAGRGVMATGRGVMNAGRAVAPYVSSPVQNVLKPMGEGIVAGMYEKTPKFSTQVTPEQLQALTQPRTVPRPGAVPETGPMGGQIYDVSQLQSAPPLMNGPGKFATELSNNYIPNQGQKIQATMENVVRGLRQPNTLSGGLQTAADVAGLFGAGFPGQGSIAKSLFHGSRTALNPAEVTPYGISTKRGGMVSPTEASIMSVDDLHSQMVAMGGTANNSTRLASQELARQKLQNQPQQLGYTPQPAPGTVPIPMAGPQRTVNIEGQSYNLPHQIDVSNSQAARPSQVVGPVMPEAPKPVQAAPTVQPVNPVSTEPRTFEVSETKPSEFTSARQQLAPTYKQEIQDSLSQLINQRPDLERFTKKYVVPEHNQYDIDNFLSGNAKQTLVYGGPGTGKTSLAGEWMAKNGGQMEYINVRDFNAKEADAIKNRLDTAHSPTLLLVDEADQLTKAQLGMVNDLAAHPHSRLLYTTNDFKGINDSIKNQSAKINMDVRMTPEQKAAFGLSRAIAGEMYGKPVNEIIGAAQSGKSFRDIKRGIPEKTGQPDMSSVKSEPMFGTDYGQIDSTPKVQQTLDNLVNNRSPYNVVIIDKSVYQADPSFSDKLNIYGHPATHNIAPMLSNPTTASPVVRIVVSDKDTANKVSALKGLIERNNETNFPTNIIIEDRHGQLDPAIRSRATTITKSDIAPETPPTSPSNSGPVTPESVFGEEFQPKRKPEGFEGLGMLTENDLPSNLRGRYSEGTLEQPLSQEMYDKHRVAALMKGGPYELTFTDGNRVLQDVLYTTPEGLPRRREVYDMTRGEHMIGSADYDAGGNVIHAKGEIDSTPTRTPESSPMGITPESMKPPVRGPVKPSNPNVMGMMTENELPGSMKTGDDWLKYNDANDSSKGFVAGSPNEPINMDQKSKVDMIKVFDEKMPYVVYSEDAAGNKIMESRDASGDIRKHTNRPDGTSVTFEKNSGGGWYAHDSETHQSATGKIIKENLTYYDDDGNAWRTVVDEKDGPKFTQEFDEDGNVILTKEWLRRSKDGSVMYGRNTNTFDHGPLIDKITWENGEFEKSNLLQPDKKYPFSDWKEPIWKPEM